MRTDELMEFCERRERLRVSGDTCDPILKEYHFCNVDREHDRVTRVVRQVVQPALTNESRVWGSVLARLVNRDETLRALSGEGCLSDQETWKSKAAGIIEVYKLNTTAYKLITPLGLNSRDKVVESLPHAVRAQKHLRELQWDKPCLRSTHGLLKVHIATFVSFQVTLDLAGTPELQDPHDVQTWTHPGPGAWRGVRRLRGEALDSKMWVGKKRVSGDAVLNVQENTALSGIAEVHDAISTRRWWSSLSTTEHVLCEWDKYERIRMGDVRDNTGRRKYRRTR